MQVKRIRLRVAYDGTDYCGWQRQNNGATVEGELQKALDQLFGPGVELTEQAARTQGYMPWEMWLFLMWKQGSRRRK